MALPAMITGFGEQSANYGAVVGQSLQQLGQQVGQQLAMREYQKQAQAQLPFIQQTMQDALTDAGSGRSAEAFSRLLPLVSNPQYTQNPYILPALETGMKLTEFTAQDAFKRFQTRQQYGVGGGDVNENVLPVMSGAEEAMTILRGGQPAVMAQPTGQPTATMLPPGTPTDAEPIEGAMPEGEVGEAESLMLTEGEVAPMQQPTTVQQTASTAFQQIMSATPSEQDRANRGIIASESDKATTWDIERIDNLSRFYPKLNISDSLAIAPVGSKVEYSETWSGQTDKPGARFAGTKKVEVDDEMNKTAKQYAGNLRNSVNLLTTSGPADSDKYWIDIIEEAGGIENVKPVRNPDDNTVSIKPRGKDLINVGLGDEANKIFNAISEVKGLSGFAQASGAKLLPENISGPGVRERKFGSVEEALASGLPAGTTVYILKDGKYKPARIKE